MNTQTLTIIVLIIIAITSVIPSLLQAMGARRNQKEMQEQMKKREEYLANLKKGDEVILLDGIHGKIVSIKGTLVELKISQNTIVYVEKERHNGQIKRTTI